ncbi:MAG: YbjQ family protein [Phycisphaerae bacterium]|nr:YbjQ family protein [Phycisphaerae bacterium]
MKAIRQIGSTVFVAGLFITIFAGIPWHVVTADDPVIPLWLRLSIFALLGGILVVLLSLAFEQLKNKPVSPAMPSEQADSSILMLNSDTVPNRDVTEVLGLAQGHTVFAIWLGNDLSAIMRLILGGELTEYTEMMGQARTIAAKRMMQQAKQMGADAVINVRYMTTSVVGTASELLVYGTAVKLTQ